MAQGNSRSAASGRKSEAVSRKRHDLRLFAANRNAATVYPFLGYLRAKVPPLRGGCAPKCACRRSPAHTLYPQGVRGIRRRQSR